MNKNENYLCTICDTVYNGLPYAGYCDESLECACDDGQSLVITTRSI
jgi:hypothetical protein